jgi:hypothetical protein
MIPVSGRGEDPFAGLPSANKRAQSLGPARHLGNFWTLPVAKDYLGQVDLVSRTTSYGTTYKYTVQNEALASFDKKLRELAGDDITFYQWKDAIEQQSRSHLRFDPNTQKFTPFEKGGFTPGDVREALKGRTAKNTDMARGWQSELNKASKKAVDDTEKSFFSYRNTNADEIARRIFVFHYWQSRAIPLHTRAALRNPMLLNSYYKLWSELEQLAEEQGHPDYLRGPMQTTFQMFQTPTGIEGHFNPLAYALPTTPFDMMDENGNPASVFFSQMAPAIAAVLAVGGADINVPDITGTGRDENFIRQWMNFLRGQGIEVPGMSDTMSLSNPTQEWTRLFLEKVNEWAVAAGIPVGDFESFNRGASELDQLRSWVAYEATQQFGPRLDENGLPLWTPEQMEIYREALVNIRAGIDGNPLSDAARENYGNEEAITAGLSVLFSGGSPVISDSRVDRMRAADEFRSRGFTGPGEEDNLFRNEATASDPTWVIASAAYHAIGTDEVKAEYEFYNDLIYEPESLGPYAHGIRMPNGEIFDTTTLLNLTVDERRVIVDGIFEQFGLMDDITQLVTERDAFKEANPEFADYLTYRNGVYQYEGGAEAFIEDMSSNPNFQRALDDRRKWLQQQGYSGATLEAELAEWASSEDAYKAAIGEQDSIYGQSPLPVYDASSDPTSNTGFREVMGLNESQGEGGGSGSGSGGTEEDEYDPKKVWVDRTTPEYQEQQWQEVENREGWANYTAEQLYGDAWNEETGKWEEWAYDDKGYRQAVTGNEAGNTSYYMTPSDTSPPQIGQAPNENRYQEWLAYMRRTNPSATPRELSIEAWAAWENGVYTEYIGTVRPQPEVPEAWLRWLEREAA